MTGDPGSLCAIRLAVYADDVASKADEKSNAGSAESSNNPIPPLSEGSALTAAEGRVIVKHTKPPTRFSEATLVAEMESLGVGRPSTYASIIENISSRKCVTEGEKGHLFPTPIGEQVHDALVGRFRFAELDYTRWLEDQLDHIAEGKANYCSVIAETWAALDSELRALNALLSLPRFLALNAANFCVAARVQTGFSGHAVAIRIAVFPFPTAKASPASVKLRRRPPGSNARNAETRLLGGRE